MLRNVEIRLVMTDSLKLDFPRHHHPSIHRITSNKHFKSKPSDMNRISHKYLILKMYPEDPYTNRGRTEEVWKVLLVYGFSRKTNAKGKHSFVDSVPSPCFEKYVRDACRSNRYLIESNGELTHFPIEKIVREVKTYPDFEPCEKEELSKFSDVELVRHSLSKRVLTLVVGSFFRSVVIVWSRAITHGIVVFVRSAMIGELGIADHVSRRI